MANAITALNSGIMSRDGHTYRPATYQTEVKPLLVGSAFIFISPNILCNRHTAISNMTVTYKSVLPDEFRQC